MIAALWHKTYKCKPNYSPRYYMLICFASYLCWSKFDPNSESHIVSTGRSPRLHASCCRFG